MRAEPSPLRAGACLNLTYQGLLPNSQGQNVVRRNAIHWIPQSSEYGTYRTVKARFGPWLSGKSPRTRSNGSLFARPRPYNREFMDGGEVDSIQVREK